MNAKQRIQEALKSIMSEGEANACRVFKGYAYSGATENTGWHYQPFNGQPVHLGTSLDEALETIGQIAEARDEDR